MTPNALCCTRQSRAPNIDCCAPEIRQTNGQKDGRTDGRYQVHPLWAVNGLSIVYWDYLPRFAVDNYGEYTTVENKAVSHTEVKVFFDVCNIVLLLLCLQPQ